MSNKPDTLKLFVHLKRLGLADFVHIQKEEIIYYHWNTIKSDLIPVFSIRNERIERIWYPRSVIPLIYRLANTQIQNTLDPDRHPFVKVING